MLFRSRGNYSEAIGEKLLQVIREEIQLEFPTSDDSDFMEFFRGRRYHELEDASW